jgi:hypothetical protein
MVNAEATSNPAEAARNREKAREAVAKAQEQLKAGKSFEETFKELRSKNKETTGGKVERHVIGASPDMVTRAFDQTISAVMDDGALTDLAPAGQGWAVGKLIKRHKGEPQPFERVKNRLRGPAIEKNTANARRSLVEQLVKKGKAKISADLEKKATDEKTKSE